MVRDAKQRFRDTLPDGYLSKEEYALYVRLYGPPLRVTEPEDVGIPTHADMGINPPPPSAEGTLIRELEGGGFEEITYEIPFEEAAENEQELEPREETEGFELAEADAQPLIPKNPDYVETVARTQREHDAMKKLLQDFEQAQENQKKMEEDAKAAVENAIRGEAAEEPETYWPPEHGIEPTPQNKEDLSSEARRFHPLSIEGRFHGSPIEIALPREELIQPVRELLERTHVRHAKVAAEDAFGGPGLPLSPATHSRQRDGRMQAVGLPPGQRHMTEIEGDAFLSGYLPPVYASSLAVLRETRKRLGGKWLQSLLQKPDGSGPSILDAGAGGGGLLAWDQVVRAEWEILKEKGKVRGNSPPGKKTVLAASDRLRDRLKSFLHNTTFLPRLPDYEHSGETKGEHLEAGSQPQKRKSFDVIIASHLLIAEKQDHHRQAVLNNLWNMTNKDGGVLIFVEKAHPRGFEAVAHVRDTVLKRYLIPVEGQPTEDQEDFNPAFHRVLEPGQIVAPCTTHSTCPMYTVPGKAARRKDFCHFSQRFVAPTFYSKMLSGSTQGEVEFSYVAFQRGVTKELPVSPAEATERAAVGFEHSSEKPDMRQLPRTLLPPLKRKGHVTLDVCTPEGKIERWTVPKSFSELAYHDARKSHWGDLWALGAKTRVERNARVGQTKDDGGKRASQDGGKRPRKVEVTFEGDRVRTKHKDAPRERRLKGRKQQLESMKRHEPFEDEDDLGDYDDVVDPEVRTAWKQQERAEQSDFQRRVKDIRKGIEE